MTLKNMKFRIASPEQSERLQRCLQSLGYDWESECYKGTVQFTNQAHVYTDDFGKIYSDLFTHSPVYAEQDTEAFIERHTERETHNNNNMKAAMAKPAKKAKRPLSLEDAYDSDCEGFFSTAEPVIEAGSPWFDNTGECPVEDANIVVDTVWRNGDEETFAAGGFQWTIDNDHDDIIKWRYSRAEDYFKAPKTAPKAVMQPDVFVEVSEMDGQRPVKRNKYMREIKPNVWVDVYDLLRAFNVTDGALAHLVKKALAVGQRGHKDATEDYTDIVASAVRAQEMHKEWEK